MRGREGAYRVSAIKQVGAVVVVLAAVLVGITARPGLARADDTTAAVNTLRESWDSNEPGLSPAIVSSGNFGQLFSTQLNGQVYAQPLVADGLVLVGTENNYIYGLDPASGAVEWSRDLGPSWPASAIGCTDLAPDIGITSTPVYDPATQTAYFMAKLDNGPDVEHPGYYLYAVNAATGADRHPPTLISGSPTNDPDGTFNAFTALQRPGLLLLGGVVYAGFAGICDTPPYVGYIAGVDAASGEQITLWSTEENSTDGEAGIWQSGGGLISDGPGQIIVATGNGNPDEKGVAPPQGPGNDPPGNLSESVIRLKVNDDGTLSPSDFFSPTNNVELDQNGDQDLGSGGPLALPNGFGPASHPDLLVEEGKDGRLFLLDRDNLGGMGQGPNGTDNALQILGPYNGLWGHPAFWPGGGGYLYIVDKSFTITPGSLRAFQFGVDTNGMPILTPAGTSPQLWGYTSGSPLVTSNGTSPGSGVVWAVSTMASSGAGGQLRAYNATPQNGSLQMIFSASIGTAAKFVTPAVSGGRVYVGTRDGRIYGFGAGLPVHDGHWVASSDGEVFTFGDAPFLGSTAGTKLRNAVVGTAATATGRGYYMVAGDGGVFSFGDARFFGSTGNVRLKQPVVGMAVTPDDKGYYLVAKDGGVFSFGTARFYGSTGNIRLKQPVVGMAVTPDGRGYTLVAADGGIFAFGDARFFGSTGNIRLRQPVVGMITAVDGLGYTEIAADGGDFTFGPHAPFLGSVPGLGVSVADIVGGARLADGGYVDVGADGSGYWWTPYSSHGSESTGPSRKSPVVGAAGVPGSG